MYVVFVFSSRTFEKEEVCEMISEQERRMKFFLRSAKLPSELCCSWYHTDAQCKEKVHWSINQNLVLILTRL